MNQSILRLKELTTSWSYFKWAELDSSSASSSLSASKLFLALSAAARSYKMQGQQEVSNLQRTKQLLKILRTSFCYNMASRSFRGDFVK